MWALAEIRYGQKGCCARIVGKTSNRSMLDTWAAADYELDIERTVSRKYPVKTTVRGVLVNLNWEDGDVDVTRLMVENHFLPVGFGKWFLPDNTVSTIAEILMPIVDTIWNIFRGEEEYVTEFCLFGMRQTWGQRQAFLATLIEGADDDQVLSQ